MMNLHQSKLHFSKCCYLFLKLFDPVAALLGLNLFSLDFNS